MAISPPIHAVVRHVSTARDYAQKQPFELKRTATGSFYTEACYLVFDDIMRAQNSKPKIDVADQLTARQKKAVYAGIKTIYEPMYGKGSNSTAKDDEKYFNLLKGYVGSYFYKQYDWFNTDQDLNILEFAALNIGNSLYQFIDAIVEPETIDEAYTDYAEQAMGTYRAYQLDANNESFKVRDELKDKRIRIELYTDPDASGNTTSDRVVFAGFDQFGNLVVWDQASYLSLNDVDITRFNFDQFKGNAMWWIDELTGCEADWKPKEKPAPTPSNPNPTAYGYVQFTHNSIATAAQMYLTLIDNFNSRRNTRDWKPWGYPGTRKMNRPMWLDRLWQAIDRQPNGKPGPNYKHEFEIDRLSYDQVTALALVHAKREPVKDSDFILLSMGDIQTAKDLYTEKHHTNPDAATLLRLNVTKQPGRDVNGNQILGTDPGFFRIHYDRSPKIADTLWLGVTNTPIQFGIEIISAPVNFLKEKLYGAIFSDEYKAKRAAIKAANGVP